MLDYKKDYNARHKARIKAYAVKLAAYVEQSRKGNLAKAHRCEKDPFLKEQYARTSKEWSQRQKELREERVFASATFPSRWIFKVATDSLDEIRPFVYFCPICFPLPSSQHRAFLAKNPSLEFSIDITFEPRKFGLKCVSDVVEHYAGKGEFPLIYHVTKQDPREFDLVDGQHQIEPRHAQNDEKNRYVGPSVY